MTSTQYQVRVPSWLEGGMVEVWNPGQNRSKNLIRILSAGVKQLKAEHNATGHNESKRLVDEGGEK